jgi:hypothetical protein
MHSRTAIRFYKIHSPLTEAVLPDSRNHSTFTDTLALPSTAGSPLARDNVPGSPLAPGPITASPLAVVTYNLSMPADLERKEHLVYEMRHEIWKDTTVAPLGIEGCNKILITLVGELNENFMTDLGSVSVAEKFAVTEDFDNDNNEYSDIKFIFVGGSHAAGMAAAADNAGWDCKNLSAPGFRITPNSVEKAAILLQEAIEDEEDKRKIVVYQLFDNNTYFWVMDNGSKTLPVRDKDDGVYHIPGNLALADHQVIMCTPASSWWGMRQGDSIPPPPLPQKVLQQQGASDEQARTWLQNYDGGRTGGDPQIP